MAFFTNLIPFQFKRQLAASLDVDQTFSTTLERETYLTSPRRYPGQIVSDLELDEVFFLNKTRDEWINLSKNPLINIDMIFSPLKTYNRGTLVFLYDEELDNFIPYLCLLNGTIGRVPNEVPLEGDVYAWSEITPNISPKTISNLPVVNTIEELEDLPTGSPYRTDSGFIKFKSETVEPVV